MGMSALILPLGIATVEKVADLCTQKRVLMLRWVNVTVETDVDSCTLVATTGTRGTTVMSARRQREDVVVVGSNLVHATISRRESALEAIHASSPTMRQATKGNNWMMDLLHWTFQKTKLNPWVRRATISPSVNAPVAMDAGSPMTRTGSTCPAANVRLRIKRSIAPHAPSFHSDNSRNGAGKVVDFCCSKTYPQIWQTL